MKKMTFAVWFTALLAVFTFSSCLSDDGENSYPISGYVQVGGMPGNYYFTNQLNKKFVPTNQNILPSIIESQYAFIMATVNDQNQTNPNSTNILLTGCAFTKNAYTEVASDQMKDERYANAPITLINAGSLYSAVPVGFWNPQVMFVPVYYFMKSSNVESENQAERSEHLFSFFYKSGKDANIPSSSDKDLVIYVRHHVDTPEQNKNRTALAMDLFQINLSQALADFAEKNNGEKPQRLYLEYENNPNSGIYEPLQVQSANAMVNYANILDNIKK